MKTVKLTDKSSARDIVAQGQREEVVVLKDGHAIALVVPFDDDDLEWYRRERDPAFLDSIRRARKQVADGKTVKHSDLKRELGIE